MKQNTFSKSQQEFMDANVKALDARMQRSQLIGSTTYGGSSAALFYDRQDQKFTLLVKDEKSPEADIYDCRMRIQWERNIMLFGHETKNGGYMALGHGTLNRGTIALKLSSNHLFFIEVDVNLPYLAPFVIDEPPLRRSKFNTASTRVMPHHGNRAVVHFKQQERTPSYSTQFQLEPTASNGHDIEEDFSDEDLARLRGEISMPLRPSY